MHLCKDTPNVHTTQLAYSPPKLTSAGTTNVSRAERGLQVEQTRLGARYGSSRFGQTKMSFEQTRGERGPLSWKLTLPTRPVNWAGDEKSTRNVNAWNGFWVVRRTQTSFGLMQKLFLFFSSDHEVSASQLYRFSVLPFLLLLRLIILLSAGGWVLKSLAFSLPWKGFYAVKRVPVGDGLLSYSLVCRLLQITWDGRDKTESKVPGAWFRLTVCMGLCF